MNGQPYPAPASVQGPFLICWLGSSFWLWALAFAAFIPLPTHILPSVWPETHTLGLWLGNGMSSLLGWQPSTGLGSDTPALYGLCIGLAPIALALGLCACLRTKRSDFKRKNLFYWARTAAAHYLALVLFVYGFEKIFKHQFYLPEPNTLYTPLGQLHPDILFWSTMGISHSYSVFAGLAEVVPAVLLLWGRTRGLGAVLALGVLVNVVALNISFDISVKLYSLFLTVVSAGLAKPSLARLWEAFVHKQLPGVEWRPRYSKRNQLWAYSLVKASVVSLIVWEGLAGFIISGNYNDDDTARPPLHGAYQVMGAAIGSDSIDIREHTSLFPRHFFFHRRGYFIQHFVNDSVASERIRPTLDGFSTLATSQQFQLRFSPDSAMLQLLMPSGISLMAKRLEWAQMPLLQRPFHWFVEPTHCGFKPTVTHP